MEVHQAQAFIAVAEELHFGRAAARLRMAQPPLSRLIKQLERSLGAPLFERSTRHVKLTAAGRALLDPARHLVEASEAAERAVHSTLTGETGRVRVGFAGASINRKVGELARQVRTARPGLMLELYSSQFSHLGLERVLDGSLDLVIGRWDFLPAEVDSAVIALEEVMVVLPSAHPLASQSSVDMADLAEESWITLPGGLGAALPNRLNSLAMASGFVPRVAQTAPDSWTQVVLVGAQMGCGLSLDSVRDNVSSEGVLFSSIAGEDRPLEVRMIWRRTDDNPALHTVIEIAQDAFPDPRSPSASR
ncbi:LysR family transcriptional regulator [Nesterenkonia sp. CL21]|uniref:LysR family transcriptional regulator n=1 Tax=Nesterenkonia sp. CL21 TaxID=3064894 RepID=UPI00287AED8D|nr:LysR family transcriptional regulator [Nesterenkonia sp. CL21]MDS2172669.1 LysR family transcriptional regulator [Nesterenkonia sp. CL21]